MSLRLSFFNFYPFTVTTGGRVRQILIVTSDKLSLSDPFLRDPLFTGVKSEGRARTCSETISLFRVICECFYGTFEDTAFHDASGDILGSF